MSHLSIALMAAILSLGLPAIESHPMGREARARQLAVWIADASTTVGTDAWLQLALGRYESDLDHRAVSPVGAQGTWQLLPQFWGAHPNRMCRERPRDCGWFRALAAARAIKHYQKRCPGMARTVRAYRSGTPGGRCLAPREKDWQVVRLRNRLKREFGGLREARL